MPNHFWSLWWKVWQISKGIVHQGIVLPLILSSLLFIPSLSLKRWNLMMPPSGYSGVQLTATSKFDYFCFAPFDYLLSTRIFRYFNSSTAFCSIKYIFKAKDRSQLFVGMKVKPHESESADLVYRNDSTKQWERFENRKNLVSSDDGSVVGQNIEYKDTPTTVCTHISF